MRITELHLYLLEKTLNTTMRISRGGFRVRRHALVELVTDEGLTGLGEGIGAAELVEALLGGGLGAAVIGLDPTNIELIRKRIIDNEVYYERMGSALCAASAIEMACWDLWGKQLGISVARLLGGRIRERIPSYASDIYWQEDPYRMADYAAGLVKLGHTTLKVHIGVCSPMEECARLEAIRAAIGDDIELMIDLNAGYDLMTACEAIKYWGRFRPKWIEEPLPPYDYAAMASLRRKASCPIAAGENEFRLQGFKQLFDHQAVDVAMPDAGRVGGLAEMRQIFTLGAAYGIPISPHNFSSGVLLAATLQLAAAMPNFSLLEVDASRNAIYDELLIEPLLLKDGMINLPDHPGLGILFNPERIMSNPSIRIMKKTISTQE